MALLFKIYSKAKRGVYLVSIIQITTQQPFGADMLSDPPDLKKAT